jgi:hypothetical protein
MSGTANHFISLLFVLVLAAGAHAGELGLVGWWRLDDGAGTSVADSSDGGHNGSFAAGNLAWVQGKFGGALKFDGTAQVEVPDHADFHLTDAVSIALWANPEAVQETDAKLFCKQKSSYYPYCLQYSAATQTIYANVNASSQLNTKPYLANFPGQWAHLCCTYDGSVLILYKDGVEVARATGSGKLQQNTLSLTLGGRLTYTTSNNFKGLIDDVRLYNRALTPQDIQRIMQGPPAAAAASQPSPAIGAVDVPRDMVLSWKPAAPGMVHDVYFGTMAADVTEADRANPKGVLVGQAQDANTYDPPGLLSLGQTYYWRADEVNAITSTISKGMIWSFATEPVAYAIKPVAVTASSSQSADNGPEKTMDGSGLNAADQHLTLDTTMWVSSAYGPQPAWIRYDFGQMCKLHQMWVWNSNEPVEPTIGFGAKDVTVEYSSDGNTWTTLAGVTQFARATGKTDYVHNTTVDLGGAAAQYVRITLKSNWGGLVSQVSLSEVRFFQIPVRAREPQPASGATGVSLATVLRWRAGREAASNQVYFGTDANALAAGTTPVNSVSQSSYAPALDFGRTYYWRIDEVNEAAHPAFWKGDVWTFSTTDFAIVDDFESYTDEVGHEIFTTWVDGYGTKTNGSQVGYSQSPFAEKTVVHSGKQSMPLAYDNSGSATYSEAERTWTTARDWTVGSADTLRLFYRGQPIGFQEKSASNLVVSAVGTDIFGTADQGRFVYKQLTGNGWISARVESLVDTDPWAKAGVMIRQSLDAGSPWAAVFLSGGNGVRFQARMTASGNSTSDTPVITPAQTALAEPVWIKIERVGNTFNGYYSMDGGTWTSMSWNPQTFPMGASPYIGLAVTSHTATAITTAEFSHISAGAGVTGSWTSADLGVPQPSNTPDQLYLTIKDASGRSKTILAAPDAVLSGTWQPWLIPLTSFTGISMDRVKSMAIGVGDRTNPKHGKGMLFLDDIAVGRPAQ